MDPFEYLVKLYIRFLYWIASPFCHQLPERSFFIAGYKLPVCARCTGIYLSFYFTYIVYPFFIRKIERKVYASLYIIMLLPLIIDGVIQFITPYESNNVTRFLTGCLAGTGIIQPFIQLLYLLYHKEDIAIIFKIKISDIDKNIKIAFLSILGSIAFLTISILINDITLFLVLSTILAYYAFLHNTFLMVLLLVLLIIYVLGDMKN